MTTLFQCHDQWARRPADERFLNLHELAAATRKLRDESTEIIGTNSCLEFVADGPRLRASLEGGDAQPVSSWAFNQLASIAKAPAAYLRSLPASLAADAMNFSMASAAREVRSTHNFLTGRGGFRAVTGPNYGRIWNADVAEALVNRFGDGVTGEWKVPGEFSRNVPITRQNTTLYAGDRDMFVFLCDEVNRIEVPNRRNGQSGSLARGFFVSNSEVGSASICVTAFLFDYACSNRIVWGAQDVQEIKMRHTSGAPDRWAEDVEDVLHDYANASDKGVRQVIHAAQAAAFDGEEEMVNFFTGFLRLPLSKTSAVLAAHMEEEARPVETLWDAATALTAHGKSYVNVDDRMEFDRLGGRVLDLVAA